MSRQSMKALAIANQKRIAGAELKREIRAGKVSIPDAFDDPRADSLSIYEILTAQRRWGRARAEKFLVDVRWRAGVARGIAERKLRSVPEGAKTAVVETYLRIYGTGQTRTPRRVT